MRLANHKGRSVIVGDEGIADLAQVSQGAFSASPDAAIRNIPAISAWWAKNADHLTYSEMPPLGEFGPVVETPSQVFAIGLNYRAHATEMAAQQQLSHQFPGEPSLLTRLTKNSNLHLDAAAENVAYASTVDQAHDVLMHSPPHRENLLNPGYNVGGFSVVRSGSVLYVTEDFGHHK